MLSPIYMDAGIRIPTLSEGLTTSARVTGHESLVGMKLVSFKLDSRLSYDLYLKDSRIRRNSHHWIELAVENKAKVTQ